MKMSPQLLPCLISAGVASFALLAQGMVIQETQTLGLNVPQGTLGTGSFINVSAQVGDVIVLTAAGNKRGTVITLSAAQVGGNGGVGPQSALSNDLATYPASFGWYQTVTNAGTFDFDVTTDNTNGITAVAGLYVLRGSGGPITLAGSATWDDNDNADNGTAYSLNYTFTSAVTNAVLIESISSRTDNITPPAAYTIDRNGSDKRVLASEEGITGSSWDSDYSLAGGIANRQTSGALGMIFGEGTGSGGPVRVSPHQGTNVLFIAIDDMKPLLGCYGDAQALTPRIDTLFSMGVTFLNAQCQWAVCGPSRASLTTGLMPEETGVIGFRKIRGDAVDPGRVNSVIRPNLVTIPQHFRYHGYRTAATGKIHDPRTVGSLDLATGKVAEDGRTVDDPPSWGEPVDPASLPADFFTHSAYVEPPGGWGPAGNPSTGATNLPDAAFADGIICDEGIRLLQNLATNDTQFFLGVGFKKPHLPFVAPQQYWDLYDRNQFRIHPFQGHPLHEVAYSWNYANELGTYDDIPDPTQVPEAKQLELIHGYYACASFIDAQVGRLLDELENLNLHTNTIVVLWGDHGFHLGDHAEWGKHTNLEQAARVPFIIYSPFTGVAGNKTGTPVTFTDIYPTLCELAGLPVPEQPLAQNEAPTHPAAGRSIKGKSLVGLMNDPGAAVRVGALTMFNRSGASGYAYRTDRYRYIEWVKGGVVDARELYDYEADPMETVNLAGESGFDALMYQYSVSMREELEQFKLSPTDLACPALQNAPVMNTATNSRALPVELEGDEVSWPVAAGVTYDLVSTTNLLTTPWTTNQMGLVQSAIVIPFGEDAAYFRIEVSN